MKLRELLKKFRPKALSGEGDRPIDNVDGMASAVGMKTDPSAGMPATFPPNYVPPVDEGRPRH